jgi:type II secretory ATPase GspE/PulE/Tfp pilus assembly ATPase PilB-like protein
MKKKFGQFLLEGNYIGFDELQSALIEQKKNKKRLGALLIELGYIKKGILIKALGEYFNVPVIDLSSYKADISILSQIPIDIARKYNVLPIKLEGNKLYIAMTDPMDFSKIDILNFVLKKEVHPCITDDDSLTQTINKVYSDRDALKASLARFSDTKVISEETPESVEKGIAIKELKRLEEEFPIQKLVNAFIINALEQGATHVHIEPFYGKEHVRFRIEGSLVEQTAPPRELHERIVNRIKVLSRLDITNVRTPQKGHIRLIYKDNIVDLIVITVPTLFGERVVLRIQYRENIILTLDKLGIETSNLMILEDLLDRKTGTILVTGPPASGKTSTIYACLSKLNKPEHNIFTIEDPIKYELPGVNQASPNPDVNFTLSDCLKSVINSNPDVVMLGECMDPEIANTALISSFGKILFFIRMHSNDTAVGLVSLYEMGVQPFIVANSVIAVTSQRLVRTLCDKCKKPFQATDDIIEGLAIPKGKYTFYQAEGCQECGFTGYKGTIGIFEVMVINEQIKDAIMHRNDANQIRQIAIENKMKTMRENGLTKLLDGEITVEELLLATS